MTVSLAAFFCVQICASLPTAFLWCQVVWCPSSAAFIHLIIDGKRHRNASTHLSRSYKKKTSRSSSNLFGLPHPAALTTTDREYGAV
mmetsp:Transcript_43142/g.122262  ORF Transcript_43142/g.122262 Transcript_43142/m.122262 type:complete len:87 (+) Transcript_43142:76-336(+)